MTARTFVLVPGAGGVAWYWHLVERGLRGAGHGTIAVDLPAADERCGLQDYAEVVVAAAGDARGAIVVGQSLGGFTAPLVCEPLGASMLVFVNAMIPRPGETAGEWWGDVGQEDARRAADLADGRDPDAPFEVDWYFAHDLGPELAAGLRAHGGEQAGGVFARPSPLAAFPDVPARVLVGRDDRFLPAGLQQRVARERLGVEPVLVSGGHLVALSNPEGVAQQLLAWAKQLP